MKRSEREKKINDASQGLIRRQTILIVILSGCATLVGRDFHLVKHSQTLYACNQLARKINRNEKNKQERKCVATAK